MKCYPVWVWSHLEKCWVVKLHSKNTYKQFISFRLVWQTDIYHYSSQWDVDSLWGSKECMTKLKRVRMRQRGGRGTKEIMLVKCIDAYESVWSLRPFSTHQCGRHRPAIPPDSCRFLEPHRFPRFDSLEDKLLHREQTKERHSQHARKQIWALAISSMYLMEGEQL